MISLNKKSGFSLAESVISLMIMSLVILLTFAAITRKKTVPVNKTTISGVYACWKEGNNIQERYYDGHSLVGWIDSNGERRGKLVRPQTEDYDCIFQMDRRAYKYYVVAVGSRGDRSSSAPNCVDGQFQQVMFPTPAGAPGDNMVLDIKLGEVAGGNGGVTSVFHGEDKVVESLGGVTEIEVDQNSLKKYKSYLVPGNIKSCKWISISNNDNPCGSGNPACEVRETYSDILASVGKNPYKTSLVLTCKANGKSDNANSCEIEIDVPPPDFKCKDESPVGVYNGNCKNGVYKGKCTKSNGDTVTASVKVEEKDSSYKAKINVSTKNSYFVHYLKMIPQNIQNGLTDDLLEYYQRDNNSKNGVVLIIW